MKNFDAKIYEFFYKKLHQVQKFMKNFKERKWAQKLKNTKVLECVLWRDSFIRRFLHRQVEDSSVSSKAKIPRYPGSATGDSWMILPSFPLAS
jgi:hypothetical protein